MSDLEFDVLDELYFIKSMDELVETTQLEPKELRPVLTKMFEKGWLRCYLEPSEEVPQEEVDLELNYLKYFYLASKAALQAHNTQ
ncbi:MAG: transporter [Cyclobacteriaceae bacterium]